MSTEIPPAPAPTPPALVIPPPVPPVMGAVVRYRFTVDGVLRARPAIVVEVVGPGDAYPRLHLHVFARPEELARPFLANVAWSPEPLPGTWCW